MRIGKHPAQRQQQHARNATPHALPALAGTDGGRQLGAREAQAELAARKIGGDVGHPDQAHHRQQKIDAQRAGLHHGHPCHPQGGNTRHQPQRGRHPRPPWHARTQQPGTAQHPAATTGQPQHPQRALYPAQRPGSSAQRQAGSAHQHRAHGAAGVEPPPLPGRRRHQHQNDRGECHGRWMEQGRQQNGQQNQGGEDALLEHFRLSLAQRSCRNAARGHGRRQWPRPAQPRQTRATNGR